MIFLCGVIVFLSGYIGLVLSKRIKQHAEYFKSFVTLCNKLTINLCFLQNKLSGVLSGSIENDKSDYAKTITSFCEKLQNKNAELFFPEYLKEGEQKSVQNFFYGLGKNDADAEMQSIKGYCTEFENFEQKYRENYAKNGSLIVKIASCAGLALAILIF